MLAKLAGRIAPNRFPMPETSHGKIQLRQPFWDSSRNTLTGPSEISKHLCAICLTAKGFSRLVRCIQRAIAKGDSKPSSFVLRLQSKKLSRSDGLLPCAHRSGDQ
jgi:hypothetical protein